MTAYIKFDGVDGEAKEKSHKKWSSIVAFTQGLHRPGGESDGSTRRRGEVVMDDILVSKKLDKASPKIAEAVLKGKVFPKVEIHLTSTYADAGRTTYYAYELKNVLVTSYDISHGNKPKQLPVEEFELNFEEIKVTYTLVDKNGRTTGNVEYSWKVERGMA